MCELNRVLSHLMFLGWLDPVFVRLREPLQAVMEEATGGRIHFVATRVGGLHPAVPEPCPPSLPAAVEAVRSRLPSPDLSALSGLGVLSVDDALSYGVSGPVARGSGLTMDLPRDAPFLPYESLDVPLVVGSEGDAAARFGCLLEQVRVSLDLVL